MKAKQARLPRSIPFSSLSGPVRAARHSPRPSPPCFAQINHARNVWDRAVSILPRIDQLWYKYIHMEEMLGNIAGARQIFERWMAWEPDHQASPRTVRGPPAAAPRPRSRGGAKQTRRPKPTPGAPQGWAAYIKMELRYGETGRARGIYERYVQCHPVPKAWLRFAKFEFGTAGDRHRAREVYHRAVGTLEGEPGLEEIYAAVARFEEMCKEPERARAIYKFALDAVPKAQAEALYKAFTVFEKQGGSREGIEDVVVSKARYGYEDRLRESPTDYDAWFDYLRLEETAGDVARTRDVYERAIAALPPAAEKRYWQRYVYIWINYALFEELAAGEPLRAREVRRACLGVGLGWVARPSRMPRPGRPRRS